MLPLLAASPATAEVLDALPTATDPFALSLNENPFPPLPAVRSALIRAIDVANRYPEFLPERLRRLIADHIGVCDEQVVLGAGASGVAMQVLHAVTRPGDRIVLSTFSKAYGLAGLRIGYGFAAPELAATLWGMQLPFGMGITGLVAVAACYDAEDQLQQRISRINAERDYLSRRLRAKGVYTTDGHANFVYLPAVGRAWQEVFGESRLKARYYADGAARITVGSR